MAEYMSGRMSENVPDRMPDYLPDRMAENVSDYLPDKMAMFSDRMPERMSCTFMYYVR